MPLSRCGSVSARFSVWFSRVSASPNCSTVDVSTSSPPGSCDASSCFAAHQIQRRAPLRSGLGQDQRSVGEIERGEADLARNLCAPLRRGHLEAAGDHQVNDRGTDRPRAARPAACRAGAARPPSCRWRDRSADRRSGRETDWRCGSARAAARRCAAAAHAGRARCQEVQARSVICVVGLLGVEDRRPAGRPEDRLRRAASRALAAVERALHAPVRMKVSASANDASAVSPS